MRPGAGVVVTEFRMLGPVEIWAGGLRVDAGQPRQRAVLAALLADAGRPVPVPTLIDRVWGQSPPRGARPSLHAHIARIRATLGAAVPLTFASGCYRLEVDPARVDLHRFRQLAARAELSSLREATALWHGMPLAGLTGAWVEQCRREWQQQHVTTMIEWARAELRAGNPGVVVETLDRLVTENPLVEPLAAVRIRALAAAGRPAEALAQYERTRRDLAAELGADPSTELRDLHRAVLRGEQQGAGPAPVTPAQLPAEVAGFAGRAEHLARLDALLTADAVDSTSPTAVVISAVSGTPGVGKTALAVRWAHQVAGRFPDGQMYLNLRGYDATGPAMSAAEAVRGLLDGLGATSIPPGADAQVALYRSLMAGKRILLLLDNARNVEQIRPLLPASRTAMVVVTSRDRLTGLIVSNGAHPMNLDVLSDRDARELLTRRLGAARVLAEPDAADRIIAACARLPLALAITAARALQTGFPLADLAAELAPVERRLDNLDAGDPASQVRGVFSWSYAALSAPARQLFRLLSLHPGPDLSIEAAASLAGLPPAAARRLLSELTEANMLTEHRLGRFSFHDLLRAYAGDLTRTDDSDEVRGAATVRLLDYFTHTAHDIDRVLYPMRSPIEIPLGPPAPDVCRPDTADPGWLDAEHANLVAVAHHAESAGLGIYACRLAWILDQSLHRRGHWLDRAAIWHSALLAAGRIGNPTVQASAHLGVAHVNTQLGRYPDADTHLRAALELYTRTGDRGGQANVHYCLAGLYGRQGEHRRALGHAQQALARHETTGHLPGQANAHNQIGWYHAQLDEHTPALAACRRALSLQQRIGDHTGQADTWDSLGYIQHHLGHHAEAVDCYHQALRLFRDLDDRYAESETLTHLGDTHRAAGDPQAARAAWRDALSILTALDHSDAHLVRARLTALADQAETPASFTM